MNRLWTLITFVPLVFVILLAGYGMPVSRQVGADAVMELYGTFHAMGITISLADIDDPDLDSVGLVEYRSGAGDQPYRSGLPLTRISPTQFVGSLFWLAPDTVYDVRVTFTDPDHDPIDGVTIEGLAATRREPAIPSPARTHFVAPDGSGSDCSLAVPCALTDGINLAQPGDEVVLRGGIYYQGDVYTVRSGAPDAPIVIRNYNDEVAILDGAIPNRFVWTSIGGGVFHTSIPVEDTNLVIADHTRLYPYPSLAELQNLPWGIPGFFVDGANLYVHLDGDADPNAVTMYISRHTYGFNVQHDYIYFANLTFQHFGLISSSRAIAFKDASHNLVQGSTFALNMMGVNLSGESHDNVIQNNTFYDAKYYWPWDAVKAASRLEQGGLDFSHSTPGRGTIIRYNIFHDYFDALHTCPTDPNSLTNETDVYGNLIYRAGDDGIQADGWCSNVRFWDNTLVDVLSGISFAPIVGGPVYALRNLIYRIGVGNNAHTGRPFKFNSSSSDAMGPVYLFHNTSDAVFPDTYGLSINGAVAGPTSLIYSRNNVWSGRTYALRNSEPGLPVDLNYDNLFNSAGGNLALWEGTVYDDFLTFRVESGQEPNGLNVEPHFSFLEGETYHLSPDSCLIDAGLTIPGINDVYHGAAPDIGAFEYDGENSLCIRQAPKQVFLPLYHQR